MPRTFLVCDGRTVTLPQALMAGAGATNMRLPPGAVVTLEDDAKCITHSRFINGRARAGDWREIDPKDAPKTSTDHVLVGDPNKAGTGQILLETGSPKKEG